jgi:hypothetical protein
VGDEVLEPRAVEFLQQGLDNEVPRVFLDPFGVGLFFSSGRGLVDRDRRRQDG